MFDILFDLLFPHNVCALCRKPGLYWSWRPWCEECETGLEDTRAARATCDKCGKYLCDGGELCADCSEKEPPFFIARSVGPYENNYKIAIKILKFLCRSYVGVRMGKMMGEVVKNEPRYWPLDLVAPVPISQANLMHRGFNQSEILARHTARTVGLVMIPDLLARIKDTPSQRELTKQEREENLKCAFEVRNPDRVKGRSVLLVDDVYTTGSTVKECAQVLLDSGASRVAVITWTAGKGY